MWVLIMVVVVVGLDNCFRMIWLIILCWLRMVVKFFVCLIILVLLFVVVIIEGFLVIIGIMWFMLLMIKLIVNFIGNG